MSSKPHLFIVEMLRMRPASISFAMSQFTSGSCISVLSTTSRIVAIGGCIRLFFFSLMISVIAISISSAAVFIMSSYAIPIWPISLMASSAVTTCPSLIFFVLKINLPSTALWYVSSYLGFSPKLNSGSFIYI